MAWASGRRETTPWEKSWCVEKEPWGWRAAVRQLVVKSSSPWLGCGALESGMGVAVSLRTGEGELGWTTRVLAGVTRWQALAHPSSSGLEEAHLEAGPSGAGPGGP